MDNSMSMSAPVDVLAEISAVLSKHGASLFFGAPADLWINGKRIGEVWHDDEGDGSRIVPVDPEAFDAALARAGGGA